MPTQAEFWKGGAGDAWAGAATRLDPLLEHFGVAAMDALALRGGERVLDVGCGAGATTRELAKRVGNRGQVVGVDIAPALLAVARARDGGVRYIEADAGVAQFDTTFDAVFSRFGVMFFDDPRAAFANLRRAAPRGRLAFVCWRTFSENVTMHRPLEIVQHLLPPIPPPEPHAPGPFAFADRERVLAMLRDSGWRSVTATPHDSMYALGEDAASATEMALTIGPLSRAVRDNPGTEASVREALFTEFSRMPGPIAFPAATWIVSAR